MAKWSEPETPTTKRSGKAAILFGLGLLSGAALGLLFGGGRFFRDGAAATQNSTDKSALTFAGAAAAKGPSGDALGSFLDSGNAGGLDRTRELLAFVDGLKPGEFGARIDEALARRKGHQGYDLIQSLYQKWVEQDPAAALHHAEALEGRDRKTALGAVLTAWAAKEPYEVLAWIEQHGEGDETRSALHAALRTIAQEDPEAAIALVERGKKIRESGQLVAVDGGVISMAGINSSFLYAIWAEKDPRAAAAAALAIPNAQERRSALYSLAMQWAMADPQAAWDWGSGLERVSDQNAVLGNIVGVVVGNGDTSQAIAFLEAMPPGQGRRQALEQIASSLANSDPAQAYELVRSQALTIQEEQAFSSILGRWARTEPARAFQIALDELDPGNARNSALQSVLNEVANRDTALALEMLGKLDEGVLRQASYSVARTLARNDRGAAIAWAETLPDGDHKQNAFSSILSEWAREAPEEASAYGLEIADENLRRRALGNALSQWGHDDAVAAMNWAVKHLGKEDQENLIPGSLLGTWANQDPKRAAAWVSALPEGRLREQSVTNLVSTWANQDLVAAGEWLKRLPSGEGRDRAAEQYASRVFDTDPEAALAWAESIGNESNRLGQMESLARRYLNHSPERARRWIARSSLPPEKQAALLQQAENR